MACEQSITLSEHSYMQLLNKLYTLYDEKLQVGVTLCVNNKKYYVYKRDAIRIWLKNNENIEIMQV